MIILVWKINWKGEFYLETRFKSLAYVDRKWSFFFDSFVLGVVV